MRKKAAKKLYNHAGFSLAETLLAVLILLLVSGIVAAGIPSARSAYEKTVLASNADVLLSTTISTLRNELGMAQDVKVEEKVGDDFTAVSYFNSAVGARSKISRYSDVEGEEFEDGEIKYTWFVSPMVDGDVAAPLISRETATGDLYVTYDTVAYDSDEGVVTFSNLSVKRTSNPTAVLATRDTLSIRVIAH